MSRSWLFAAVVVLVAFVAAWPDVGVPGLLNTRGGGDSPFLLQRLHQLVTAVAGGSLPARWMPDANYGYGYPFYNFYAPLSIYIAGAFRALGFSFVRSIHMAQLAGFVVAGLGAYALGRNWLDSRWAGLLAAVAYTVAPFHMVNVYVRGDSLAEFWAMALYPVVLLAADGLLDAPPGQRPRRVALFALAYAALILSHNISALIFTPFLLLYLGLRLFWPRPKAPDAPTKGAPSGNRWRAAVCSVVGLVLALGLAAWFFVPALAEQDLAQLGPVTAGYFHFSNHFRAADLVQTSLLFDYSPDGGVAFRMGLVQTIMAVLGGAILLIYTRQRRPKATAAPERLAFIGLMALVATFMITPLSRPLWDHLPLLAYTQFPWRFLSVQALATALLTAGLAWPTGRQAVVPVATLVLLLAGLLGLRTDHLMLTDADITAERLAQYEWFTGNIGSTVSAEYLPPTVVPRPYSSDWLNSGDRWRPIVLSGSLDEAQLLRAAPTTQEWQLAAGSAGAVVVLPTLYWPDWTAASDGQPIAVATQPGSGLLRLEVPPGDHHITLSLANTPVRTAANWASLLALLAAAVLLVWGLWAQPELRSWWRWAAAVAVGVVALAGLSWALRQTDPPPLPRDDLTWDFAQMAYLHHDPTGVAYDNGLHLYSYGYSHDEIQAGQTLTLTLSIDPVPGLVGRVDLATPALARPVPNGQASPPVMAGSEVDLSAESAVVTLGIPANVPTGLYVPRLAVPGSRPLMPSGQARGDLFLRPLRVVGSAEAPPPTTTSDDALAPDLVATVIADELIVDGRVLEGRFTWRVNRSPGQNLQVSWRLLDPDGVIQAQLDTQPGYGFQPTSGWPANESVHDWLTLQLPEALPGPGPYPLVMILYDPRDGREIMTRHVGELTQQDGHLVATTALPTFTMPDDATPLPVVLGDDVRPLLQLDGYTLDQTAGTLRLTFYWQALEAMSADARRFVHLIDTNTGEIVAQIDGHPVGNSYPVSQWPVGGVVADSVSFDLGSLLPGSYQIATGFYRPEDGRLAATAATGPLADGRVLLPETITLP